MSGESPVEGSDEVHALRRRVAELEGRLGQSDARRERERFFALALDLMCIVDFQGVFRQLSPRWESVFGHALDELRGRQLLELIHPDDHAPIREKAARMLEGGGDAVRFESRFRGKDGAYRWLEWNAIAVLEEGLTYASARDVTERKEAEALIRRQAEALRALSTPLIPINDRVLVMPLVGAMDAARAEQVLETLLDGVVQRGAGAVILDVTGVGVVDTQVADALLRAARALRLVGAEVLLTGIRPDVAQTLVHLGVDLGGLVTCSTLQAGIARASRLSARGRGRGPGRDGDQ